jgi:bidirectional [NiFe] hydrogenase diaphorase subunit
MTAGGEPKQHDVSPSAADPLERAMARHHYSGDSLIEVLHAAQELYGHLTPALLKRIARALRLPPSRVLGVATFYHLFRFHPKKTHSAVVCSGTACYVAGSTELAAVLTAQRGLQPDQWTVDEGRCVGSCGLAPIVICDGSALPKMTPRELTLRIGQIHDGHTTPPHSPR